MIAILQQELADAYNSELDSVQSMALDYYNAVPGHVPAGWSSLVSPDVRDALESTMSEITGAINPNEPLAFFTPVGEEDIPQAELETQAVHNVIFDQNRGFILLETAFRDALLQRYGVIRVGMANNRVQLHSVPPENFRWSYDLTGPFLEEARFVAEKFWYTRAQLREMGAKNVDKCSITDSNSTSTEMARESGVEGFETAARREDDNIPCWYCYLRDNGSQGGYKCYLINNNLILKSERVDFLPFAAGVSTIRPHRFDGVSLFDRIAPLQSTKTYLLRQLATNARLASQVRLAIRDRGVNPDDLLSDELNPIIRCSGLPSESLVPLPSQDVTSQLLATLQWMDGIRRDDGGASIDMNSPQMTVANQSAHAVEREYSFRELQASAVLRTLGETLIRSLYLIVHATLRSAMGQMLVRGNDRFAAVSPAQFPQRGDLLVDIGSTMGTKLRNQNALAQIVQQQMLVLQTGGSGLLVGLDNIYLAQVEYAKAAGLKNPELYWTDPRSPEAQMQAQQQAMAAQAEKEAAAALQEESLKVPIYVEQAKSEGALMKQHVDSQHELMMKELELKQKYFETIVKNQADERALDIKEIEVLLQQSTSMAEDEVGEATV
jgi:hypothetical protein